MSHKSKVALFPGNKNTTYSKDLGNVVLPSDYCENTFIIFKKGKRKKLLQTLQLFGIKLKDSQDIWFKKRS